MVGRHRKDSSLWVAFAAAIGILVVVLGIWWVFESIPDGTETAGQTPTTSSSVPPETWTAPPVRTTDPVVGPENRSEGATKAPVTRSTKTPRPSPQPDMDQGSSGY